jgi:hypothetical protein
MYYIFFKFRLLKIHFGDLDFLNRKYKLVFFCPFMRMGGMQDLHDEQVLGDNSIQIQ